LDAALAGKAAASHTHPQSEVTNLVTDLAGKAPTTHTHVQADVTGLVSALAGKAASSHTHAQSDVTNLVADLAGKAAVSHVHAASEITSGVLPMARLATGTPDGTKFIRDDGTLATPSGGGGADPWTHLRLGVDFTTTSATAVDATGLAITPAPNTQYVFEAYLLMRTATTTVGPRPGLAWATGMADGVATIQTPSSATAFTTVNGNIAAPLLAAVGGLPSTTQSFQGYIWGTVLAGASPSGTVRVQLASETAGTTVTYKAGSFLRYRVIS